MAALESKYMAILNNLSPNSLCLHLFLLLDTAQPRAAI